MKYKEILILVLCISFHFTAKSQNLDLDNYIKTQDSLSFTSYNKTIAFISKAFKAKDVNLVKYVSISDFRKIDDFQKIIENHSIDFTRQLIIAKVKYGVQNSTNKFELISLLSKNNENWKILEAHLVSPEGNVLDTIDCSKIEPIDYFELGFNFFTFAEIAQKSLNITFTDKIEKTLEIDQNIIFNESDQKIVKFILKYVPFNSKITYLNGKLNYKTIHKDGWLLTNYEIENLKQKIKPVVSVLNWNPTTVAKSSFSNALQDYKLENVFGTKKVSLKLIYLKPVSKLEFNQKNETIIIQNKGSYTSLVNSETESYRFEFKDDIIKIIFKSKLSSVTEIPDDPNVIHFEIMLE